MFLEDLSSSDAQLALRPPLLLIMVKRPVSVRCYEV